MVSDKLKLDFLNNRHLMIMTRELLFEFMDLSDDLLKKYGLKKKLESEICISNKTLWRIGKRKDLNLPENFFLNQFWQKFFNVVYYTFDLLDNEFANANFAELEERYGMLSDHSITFYLSLLYSWISDTHRSCERYSTLLNTEKWKHIKEIPTYEEILENFSGSVNSGNGSSDES